MSFSLSSSLSFSLSLYLFVFIPFFFCSPFPSLSEPNPKFFLSRFVSFPFHPEAQPFDFHYHLNLPYELPHSFDTAIFVVRFVIDIIVVIVVNAIVVVLPYLPLLP